MKVDVLLGLQWGDEGKGKVVDVLTPNYDAVTRFQEVQMQAILWCLKTKICSSVYSFRNIPRRKGKYHW